MIAYSTHRAPTVPAGFGSEMIIKDTVVHDVDTVRSLLGQELAAVTVPTPRPTAQAPANVHDPQMVIFETSRGVLVHVEAFVRAQYGYDIRCEVVGEAGTLALSPPAAVALHRDGQASRAVSMRFQERFAAAYIGELQAWVASITDGKPAGASAWDGYAATVVSEAACQALATRQPVTIALDDNLTSTPSPTVSCSPATERCHSRVSHDDKGHHDEARRLHRLPPRQAAHRGPWRF